MTGDEVRGQQDSDGRFQKGRVIGEWGREKVMLRAVRKLQYSAECRTSDRRSTLGPQASTAVREKGERKSGSLSLASILRVGPKDNHGGDWKRPFKEGEGMKGSET